MARRKRKGRSKRPPTMRDLPYQLVGASDFTRDRRDEVHDVIKYLTAFVADRALSARFLEATDYDEVDGRPRKKGHWGLAYLAFTASTHGSMLPFWRDFVRNDALLDVCGFRQDDGTLWRPSYAILTKRFHELEQMELADPQRESKAGTFMATGGRLVRRARGFEPAIGAHVAVDGTEGATHARVYHDCGPDDPCPDRVRGKMASIDSERAKLMRQRQAELEDPDAAAEVVVDGLRPGEVEGLARDEERGGVTWRSANHRWWCRDEDAGPRAYVDEDGRVTHFWVGDLAVHAHDLCTGGMLGVLTRPANVDEHTGFEELLDQVTDNAGAQPLSAGVDSGYYWPRTYLAGTRRGVAMIGPHRRPPNSASGAPAAASPRVDEFGDPVCAHCRGRTRRVGFSVSQGRPRITFVCALPQTPECQGRQTIECTADPRRLIAISRRSRVYRALSRARRQLERGHKQARERYLVSATALRERPRRLGAGPRHLRAVAAMIVDWVRICLRHGWLGGGPLLGARTKEFLVPPLKPPSDDALRHRARAAAARRRTSRSRRPKRPPPSDS